MTTSSISRSNRGFTLVELLAVIVISSILIVVAMQGIKVVGSTALQTGVRQFSNDLQMARQYAITKRTRVRVLLAVDTGILNPPFPSGFDTNTLYRAYCVYAITTNAPLATGDTWVPNAEVVKRLTDWRVLPNGVVFSDQKTASGNYSPMSLAAAGSPTNGQRFIVGGQNTPSPSQVNSTFDCQKYVSENGVNIFPGSGIDFLPSGRSIDYRLGAVASKLRAGGVRLAQGSAVNDGSGWTVIINNTSNWAYVEYDFLGGRIRTRWVDSYK